LSQEQLLSSLEAGSTGILPDGLLQGSNVRPIEFVGQIGFVISVTIEKQTFAATFRVYDFPAVFGPAPVPSRTLRSFVLFHGMSSPGLPVVG
jgi:hypothetical protein